MTAPVQCKHIKKFNTLRLTIFVAVVVREHSKFYQYIPDIKLFLIFSPNANEKA